jgi:hypothetical protein
MFVLGMKPESKEDIDPFEAIMEKTQGRERVLNSTPSLPRRI